MSSPLDTVQSSYDDDRHRHHFTSLTTEVTFDRFTESAGEVKAECTIRTELPPASGVLSRTRLNLISERSIKMLANTLQDRVPGCDWYGLVQKAALLTVDQWREGSPLIRLADVTPAPGLRWVLSPLLEHGGPTVMFAPGGSGKSYLAMSVALSIASGMPAGFGEPEVSGPVAYLDWESDPETQLDRMDRIGKAMGIPNAHDDVWYRREDVPLRASADQLRHQLADRGIVAAVIDSIGWATGGAPESAEETIRTFAAVRKLGVPCLCIDHVTNEAAAAGKATRAFGSAYKANAARRAWSLSSRWSAGRVDLRLENTKANNGPKSDPIGVTLEFSGDRVHVYSSAPPVIADQDGDGPIWERIAKAITDFHPMTAIEIADLLGITPGNVRAALSRYSDRFRKTGGDRWDYLPNPFEKEAK